MGGKNDNNRGYDKSYDRGDSASTDTGKSDNSKDYSEGIYESYEPTTDQLDDNSPPAEDSGSSDSD